MGTSFNEVLATKKKKTLAESMEKQGYKRFWTASLSDGLRSKKTDSLVDLFEWMLENVDERVVSSVLINRHWINPDRQLEAAKRRAAKIASPRKYNIVKVLPPKKQNGRARVILHNPGGKGGS